ncbi:MAG: helix-hairpin-helix domain-containing protein [Halofilum sp. (in: g-proteobacteria)]
MIRKIVLAMVLALATGAAVADEKIDINTANAENLAAALDGVGEVRAQAIVDYREANGDFPSVASLTAVTGIGPATLESNQERLTVGATE